MSNEYYVPAFMDKKYKFEESDFSIAFVGDLHLHAQQFSSRIDDYPNTAIQKLGILRRELISKGIKYLFLSGDIFHIPKERTDYEFAVIKEFLKFRESGIEVFSINGNHDLAFERLENIEKSSLGILFLTDTVHPFSLVQFDRGEKSKVNILGCNFPNEPLSIHRSDEFNILVAHKFFANGFDEDSLSNQDCEMLGYNMFALG